LKLQGDSDFRGELYEKLRESNIEALKSSKEIKLDDIIKE